VSKLSIIDAPHVPGEPIVLEGPRYRVESKDGVKTTVFDLATGEDISHTIAAVYFRCEPERVVVEFVMRDASVAFDLTTPDDAA
jgi:hypothetical protein